MLRTLMLIISIGYIYICWNIENSNFTIRLIGLVLSFYFLVRGCVLVKSIEELKNNN